MTDSDSKPNAIEEHFTVGEIAARFKLSEDTVRRLFSDESGVLKLGEGTRLAGRKYKRRYFSLRIPESVLVRVMNRLMHKRPAGVPEEDSRDRGRVHAG
jgi:AraC-like DNA-binding protein